MSGKAIDREHASALDPNMNKISNLLYHAFRSPPAVERAAHDAREVRKEIVRAHAHGNIRLQLGHWYTQGDVNDWKETFREYSFSN